MSATIIIEIKKADSVIRALGKLKDQVIPKASRSALNKGAFLMRKLAVRQVKREFVIRNTWTERSIQYRSTRSLDLNRQETRTGSTMDYMREQEFGGKRVSKGATGLAIPGAESSGESPGTYPRRRSVRKLHYRSNIQLKHPTIPTGGTRASRTQAAINQVASMSGRRYLYLNTGKVKGIFFISGGKRRRGGSAGRRGAGKGRALAASGHTSVRGARGKYAPRRPAGSIKRKVNATPRRLQLIYDLRKRSVVIKPKPWLKVPRDIVTRQMPKIYMHYMKYYVQRLRK